MDTMITSRLSTLRRAGLLALAASLGALVSCAERPRLDFERDWTEEVERICSEYCDIYMACDPEPWFVTHEECMVSELGCLGATVMYWDNECGEVTRAKYQCVADATTCDEYDKVRDVSADDYPCKALDYRMSELKCGLQDPP